MSIQISVDPYNYWFTFRGKPAPFGLSQNIVDEDAVTIRSAAEARGLLEPFRNRTAAMQRLRQLSTETGLLQCWKREDSEVLEHVARLLERGALDVVRRRGGGLGWATANQKVVPGTYTKASAGLWPKPYVVNAGTVLYRFVDLDRAEEKKAADGPWWFEFEHYQSIKHFGVRNGYSLGYSARLFAAILYEWSEVNGVVRARVKVPLSCWKGRGKQITVQPQERDARDKNRTPHGMLTERTPVNVTRMTPLQGPNEVFQLHIPGLGRPHQSFPRYMELLGSERIQTG